MNSPVRSTYQPDSDHALAGRYELVKCLAKHGSCSVFQAYDQVLKRPIAVKVLTEQIMSEEELRRFHRGALAACAVKHQNCVQVYDFGMTAEERPYMVMEFVQGETLRRVVQERGPMRPAIAVDVTIQILDGLSAVHTNGIIHRDLKTANVMVEDLTTKTPKVKILDFGLAKRACPTEDTPITKAGQIVGSPVYMSPEQVRGHIVDARSDIYAVGCILFELLTADPLFLGKTSLETMSMHCLQLPPSLKKDYSHRDFPQELDRVVAFAVSKNPCERFQSAQEMKEVLEQVAELMKTRRSLDDTLVSPAVHSSPRRKPNWLLLTLFVLATVCLAVGMTIFHFCLTEAAHSKEPASRATVIGYESSFSKRETDMLLKEFR
ncbi:MAG: serine/threonine protein kinase [Candidatus Obscuribacterales bacterium]|nr:serine/threonine protein kinase [Candidatus Obscuribacterales bacterium]